MIYTAIIAICCVAMGIVYLIATNAKYKRLQAEKKAKEIRDAEEKLRKALREHSDDIMLHCALYDNLKRLRQQ